MTEGSLKREHSVNAGASQIVESLTMPNQVHDLGAVWQMNAWTPARGAHRDVALDPEHTLPASDSSPNTLPVLSVITA